MHRRALVSVVRWLALAVMFGGTVSLSGVTQAADRFISIGTGGVTGMYYPTGGAICRVVNKGRTRHHIRCTVESTSGSVYNVRTVTAGDLDFGIVQSDVQYEAVHGVGPFDKKAAKLRAVFSIYPETTLLVVRADSGIRSGKDMKGKRINIGNTGSGTSATAEVVLDAFNLKKGDLKLAAGFRSAEQGGALQKNKIDGFIFLVGHPNSALIDIFASTDARLIPLTGPGVDQILKTHPYYVRSSTPGGIYRGVDEDVPTFAVKATFITSADVSAEVVYEVVKSVFDNLESLKSLHPAYAHLMHEQMLEGLSAPLHPGALKYYKEKGWR